MRNVILGAAGLLASAVALPTVAVAAEVRFTLTNDVTPGAVTWLLPQAPTPSFFVDDFFFALDGPILGTFEGTEAGGGTGGDQGRRARTARTGRWSEPVSGPARARVQVSSGEK